MTKQQFSFNGIYFVDNNKGQLSHSEVVELLNTLHQENQELKEENEQLKKLIERKDILLKNRTEYIEDRIQSFNDFISYRSKRCQTRYYEYSTKMGNKKRECCR